MGSQRRNEEAGTAADYAGMLLIGLLPRFLSPLALGDLPRDSNTHSQLSPPTLISNQENAHKQADLTQETPQLGCPLPSV